MRTFPPRERTFGSSRKGNLVKSPRADEGASAEVRTVRLPSTEESSAPSSTPTLDDFGGRSDALGG